jgi:hypothetical protein
VGFSDFQPAARVLGQADFAGTLANQGGAAAADTLADPFGRAAPGSLYVPDQANHRVLGFDPVPNVNGGAAAFALGQPDLVTATPGTTATTLRSPTDAWTTGSRLAVADRLNHRVLVWNPLPAASGAPASLVVGQPDFASAVPAAGATGLNQPAGVCVAGGRLFVADYANNRVLVWNTFPAANGVPADVVVGQADFAGTAPATSASRLSGPTAVWSNGTRLVVVDSGNHRVLLWNTIPASNGASAHHVIGQPDFTTAVPGAGPQGLTTPASVFATSAQLFVADLGNNRVLVYQPYPTADQPAAARVLGQGDFTHVAPNDDDQDGAADLAASARTLSAPAGVVLVGDRLYVTDRGNHRVLVFEGS